MRQAWSEEHDGSGRRFFHEAGIEARYVPYDNGNAAAELSGRCVDAALQ